MAEVQDDEIRTVTIGKWASSRVTALISVALFIMATLVFLLTDSGQQILNRSVVLRTYFDDGTGLVRTADVMLDGIKVGDVKAVSLADTNEAARSIEVQMKIRKNFLAAIPDDSQTEITADNLVGDKYINIKRGLSNRHVNAGDELKRVPPMSNFDPADLLASLSGTLKRATTLLDQIENPDTPLGTLVKKEDLYTKVRDDIRSIQDALTAYASPKSPVGQAIYGQDLYNQIRKPALEFDKQLSDIEERLKDSTQYDNALAGIRKFHDSVRKMETAPLLSSDEQYREALKMLHDLDAAFDETTQGDGQIAQLLTNTQLYEQLAGSSRDTQVFLRDFRLNPRKYLRIKIF